MLAHLKNHDLGRSVLLKSKYTWYLFLAWRKPKYLLLRYIADPAGPGNRVPYDLDVKASKNLLPAGFKPQTSPGTKSYLMPVGWSI